MERKPITPENALMRLEALCARSEHCAYELRSKLRTWGIAADAADKIIASLTKDRFVDDTRFARSFVNDKFRFSGHGRMKIRMALVAKRIDRNIINDAIALIDSDEYAARLREILAAKARRIDDIDTYEGRTRLFRFGVSRGFESDAVAEAIREMFRKK